MNIKDNPYPGKEKIMGNDQGWTDFQGWKKTPFPINHKGLREMR
jgi:hypothetical protein